MQPDLPSLLILGIINGSTVCAFSCLPLIGPYVLGSGKGMKHGTLSFLTFGSGKLVGYSFLGGMAAYLGQAIPVEFSATLRPLAGLFLLIAAFSILWGRRKSCACKASNPMGGASLFGIGLSTSLIPCPTLGAVILTAAHQSSIFLGMACGMLFSIGLLLSPLLLFSSSLGLMGKHIREKTSNSGRLVAMLSVTLMITAGIRMIFFEV